MWRTWSRDIRWWDPAGGSVAPVVRSCLNPSGLRPAGRLIGGETEALRRSYLPRMANVDVLPRDPEKFRVHTKTRRNEMDAGVE